ncbi:MAG: hypothetical protein ACIARR_04225 [Phycisphaerales bacterium JB059]
MLALRPIPEPGASLSCDAWSAPGRAGVILDLDSGEPFAEWRADNPIDAPPVPSPQPAAPRLAPWSGWIIGDDDRPSPHTWTPEGWKALDRWLDDTLPRLDASGHALLLRPDAGHILSDARSCLSILQQRQTPNLRLLLDPVAMLTPDMLPDAEDHLRRFLDALLHHPATAAVILTDATPERDRLTPRALGDGVLDPGLLDRLIERVLAAEVPPVLLGDPAPQLARLPAP